MPNWVLAAAAPLGFAVWWAVVLCIIGWLSGWQALASRYPGSSPFEGVRRRFQRIHLGWAGYNNCVTIGTNADGLHLSLFWLFRPGHPPIFVPWSEITARMTRKWWSTVLELRFAAAPSIAVRLSEQLGRQIAADAAQSWDLNEPRETGA